MFENQHNVAVSCFEEVRGRTSVIAFFLGMAIIAVSFFLGRSYLFYASFLVFSMFITLLWRNAPRPWIFLVSVTAAMPFALSKYGYTCNLIFAFWFALFNMRHVFRLPRWFYVPTILVVFGLFTSSINWISGDVPRSIMRQLLFLYNLFLGPFLLLPSVYLGMKEGQDHGMKLQGLLFCLIIPSTLILLLARFLGNPVNEWEASLHGDIISHGFLIYELGKWYINFMRTEVGFILSALVCASAAIIASGVKPFYRILSGACFASNASLLIGAGSFGSGVACFCGISAIFFAQSNRVSIRKRVLAMIAIACILFLIYMFIPPDVKEYLAHRYEHRIIKSGMDQDRFILWGHALRQLIANPEEVGWTGLVGNKVQTWIHNEYLTYAVSYGLFGGLGYISLCAGLLVSFYRRGRRLINDSSLHAIYLAGLGVLVSLLLNSMTDHANENRWYFNVMWSLIWYCYFCSLATDTEVAQRGKAF